MKAEWELPAPDTLRLYRGPDLVFASDRHWLHPLFELEEFLARSGQETAGTCLLDRVTGRAAAFLLVRLGIRNLSTLALSRRALPVLVRFGVVVQARTTVDRIGCATEDLLAAVEDPEAAWVLLQERRRRAGPSIPNGHGRL